MYYLKVTLLLGFLILIANCAVSNTTTAQQSENSSKQNVSESNNSEIPVVKAGNFRPLSEEEAVKIDEARRSEIEIQKEKLKGVPDALRKIDFKNFTYSYKFSNGKKNISLADGKFTFEFADDRGWFDFKEAYFVDLTGDGESEAVVYLNHVSCGASCDGGRDLFYVFWAGNGRPELLWQFEGGSRAYGCGLKSFDIKEKRAIVKVFGKCDDKMMVSNNKEEFSGKFSFKGYTQFTYAFDPKSGVKLKEEFFPTEKFDTRNYKAEISIDE